MRGRLNPKSVARRGVRRERRHKMRAWLGVTALVFAGVAAIATAAISQTVAPTGTQATSIQALKGQDGAILEHLNAAIQFYRTVNEPMQKAGEPNDVVYREQAIAQAAQVGQLAFESAKAEAALIASGAGAGASNDEQQRIQTALAANEQRIKDLEAREKTLDGRIGEASGKTAAQLDQERQQVHAALELARAIDAAMHRITETSGARGATGLAADVSRLEQSIPELKGNSKTSPPPMTTIDSALSEGVTTQSMVLLHLVETLHALQTTLVANDRLKAQATEVRAPMLSIVRGLVEQGQQLSAQTEAALPAAAKAGKGRSTQAAGGAGAGGAAAGSSAGPATDDLESITRQFKALSAATVPLSEEIIVLDESHANLAAWQASVRQEYGSILHSLLLRILVIVIALGAIIGAGEAWTRATNRYIRDLRRRRQLLIVQRVVVGLLSAMVLLFGFVTRFDSLATFAGFITAGIAVGLQTILLSVAAYFFIIGRFGIRVGDRITVAAVTGDVIEVGLVRFYLMELAGSGTALNPTGRVAVFSNAVLFQAGTPLYKQLPGTGYAWHELTVKLADGADYKAVCDAIMKEIHAVYEGYRAAIEHQHQAVQQWMQAMVEEPAIESRLQFTGGVFQLWVRFPVEIREAAETDEKITEALLRLIAENPAVKAAVTGMPSIQPSVRG